MLHETRRFRSSLLYRVIKSVKRRVQYNPSIIGANVGSAKRTPSESRGCWVLFHVRIKILSEPFTILSYLAASSESIAGWLGCTAGSSGSASARARLVSTHSEQGWSGCTPAMLGCMSAKSARHRSRQHRYHTSDLSASKSATSGCMRVTSDCTSVKLGSTSER